MTLEDGQALYAEVPEFVSEFKFESFGEQVSADGHEYTHDQIRDIKTGELLSTYRVYRVNEGSGCIASVTRRQAGGQRV